MTGPLEIFEGNKGFKEAISGPFHINWKDVGLDLVTKTIIKKYNAEIHSQSALEGILELCSEKGLKASDVERIDVAIFDVAYHIIGGGEEGTKKEIRTKEEADHSLPYMLAVALLDGQVLPSQYEPERIVRHDVQTLLQKIHIRPDEAFSARFPHEMPVKIVVTKKDGSTLEKEKSDYEGFFTRPMTWQHVEEKFRRFSKAHAIIDACRNLDKIAVRTLTELLSKVE